MGMETALPHVSATRNQFGVEITRLDMKLLSDMLTKKSYDERELLKLKKWIKSDCLKIELPEETVEDNLDKSLALYLIVRDMMKELNAVGGGFMSQLEWGSIQEEFLCQLPILWDHYSIQHLITMDQRKLFHMQLKLMFKPYLLSYL